MVSTPNQIMRTFNLNKMDGDHKYGKMAAFSPFKSALGLKACDRRAGHKFRKTTTTVIISGPQRLGPDQTINCSVDFSADAG
jgi:hypothetical protein